MWNIFGRYRGRKALPSARQMNLIAAILNHVTQGTGIAMETPQMPSTEAPWVIGIDTAWLKDFVEKRCGISGDVGNPEYMTFPDDGTDPQAPTAVWTAGGAAGVTMDVYMRAEDEGGLHYLYRGTWTFSKDGLLRRVELKQGYKEV